MESRYQTSFIPKAPIQQTSSISTKRPVSILSIIATFLFIVSVVGAGGAYAFEKYLKQQIDSKITSLEKTRKAFEPTTIETYSRLDNRIETAKQLLNSHVAASLIFSYLQDATLKTIDYTSFDYKLNSDGKVDLSIKGEAKGYNSIAYQSQIFTENRILRDFLFTDFSRTVRDAKSINTEKPVGFSLTAHVDSDFALYKKTIRPAPSAPTEANTTNQPPN